MSRTSPPPAERRLVKHLILPAALVLVALGASLVFFQQPADVETVRDADLCPLDEAKIVASAALLLDLNKPLDPTLMPKPDDLLRAITLDMASDTELRVYALGDSPHTPRRPVGRLCKPYDNSDLNVTQAKDEVGGKRDCRNLPAVSPGNDRRMSASPTPIWSRRSRIYGWMPQVEAVPTICTCFRI